MGNVEKPPFNSLDFGNYEAGELTVSHFWCPYCGGWHGSTPLPKPEGDAKQAPKLPPVIAQAVREVMESETNVKWKPLAEEWPDRGSVDGEPAAIKQEGDRTRAIWDGTDSYQPDPYGHGEIVTNDGLNASYVRDVDGRVVVDDRQRYPYEPYTQDTSNRYTFE